MKKPDYANFLRALPALYATARTLDELPCGFLEFLSRFVLGRHRLK